MYVYVSMNDLFMNFYFSSVLCDVHVKYYMTHHWWLLLVIHMKDKSIVIDSHVIGVNLLFHHFIFIVSH